MGFPYTDVEQRLREKAIGKTKKECRGTEVKRTVRGGKGKRNILGNRIYVIEIGLRIYSRANRGLQLWTANFK